MSFLNSMKPEDLYAPYNPDDNLTVEECQDIIKNIHSNRDKSMSNTITDNINDNNTSSISRTPQPPIITEAPSGYNTLIHLNKTIPPSTPQPPIITEAPNGYNTLIPLSTSSISSTPQPPIITEAPSGYNTLIPLSTSSNTINFTIYDTIYNKIRYNNSDNNNQNNNNDNNNQETVIDLDTVDNIPITINNNTLEQYKYYICPFIGFNLSNDLFCQFTLSSCTKCSKAWMKPLRSIKRMFKCFPADKHNNIDKCDECTCCCSPCICCIETCITCFIFTCIFDQPYTN
jgi:hypothetical protein